MSNFFNAIGMADLEKVHSAMIAWILADDKDPLQTNSRFKKFPIQVRSSLLCQLFNVPYKLFDSIVADTEWNDIDILIQTRDTDKKEEVWVIENKLKSQEHKSNFGSSEVWQTEKYRSLIEVLSIFNNKDKHYMLLSISGDEAKDKKGNWSSCSYRAFWNYLNERLTNIESEYPLIKEYSNCLSGILEALKCFLVSDNRSKDYPHVFQKLKKAQKKDASITEKEKDIIENGLETIFQKQLLAKLIKESLQPINNPIDFDERNGIAMFVQTYKEYPDFKLIIEFQGGTYKVALHHNNYNMKSSSKETSRLYGQLVGKEWDGAIFKAFKNHSGDGWRIAVSKNLKRGIGEAKPRIALDKNIGKKWCDDMSQFKNGYHKALELAESISKELDPLL